MAGWASHAAQIHVPLAARSHACLLQPSANLEHVLLGRLFAALKRRGSDGAPQSARARKPSSVLKLGGDSGLAGPPVPADSATVSVAPVFEGRSINAGN